MTLRQGDRVAGWTLESRLGEGGTATVWRVRKGGERGVLKTLRPELSEEADWRARLLREAEALRAATHPNVVALLDAGTTEDELPFVVMPEIPGETLGAALARDGAVTPARAWSLLRPIALALAAAHDAGVVHRDVKPDNIVLEPVAHAGREGELKAIAPKLVDFGIARPHGQGAGAGAGASAAVPKVTATGTPIGTPAYMAPEQWWNADVGPPADQYALGVTLFEAMTGKLPFDDTSFADLVQAHVSKKPSTLAARGVVATEAVERFVARLMAKTAGARFASMQDAVAAGDVAFGGAAAAAAARWSPRALALPVFFLAYGAAQLALFGYPRATTLAEWLRGAGAGVYVPLALYASAAALLLVRRIPRAGAEGFAGWVLAIGAAGTFATYTGFGAVFNALGKRPPEEAFEIFHEGAWEAGANRYVGFALAAALLFAVCGKVRAHATPPTSRERALSFVALALAMVCVTLRTPSAAIPFAALAFASALGNMPATALAVVLASASAVTRAQALGDAVWSLEPTRAARAVALAAASHERSNTLLAAGLASAVAIALAAPALGPWRARLRSGGRGARRTRLVVALFGVWAVADVALVVRTHFEKRALYTYLEPEFALFSRLDPPTAVGAMGTPPLRPTLKIARDRIALDRVPVGLASVLESDEGLAVLRTDLSHRVAQDAAQAQRGHDDGWDGARDAGRDAELLVMADASLPPERVTRALRAAYDVGVRRVGVLFLRGPPLPAATSELQPSVPEEAAYALPRDFGMVRVRLGLEGGTRLDGPTFGDAADRLFGDQLLSVASAP